MTPDGWERRPVSALGEVVAGKAKNVRGSGTSRPYLRVANVFDGRIDISDVLEMPFSDAEFDRYQLRSGDVLLNEGQSLELVGRCAMYRGEFPAPCAIQNALVRFRAGTTITPEYAEQLFRWCQQTGIFAEIATQTTSIAHLGVQRFAQLEVPRPPLPEQRKIAAILSSIDEAIEATQAVIDQLQVLKKAMMAELLTKGLPGRHTRFKQTEIGEIPEEWRVSPLGQLFREPIRNGYSPICPTTPTGRWILHLGAVTFDGFNPRAVKPAPIDDRRLDGAIVERGDLLMSRSNTRERVGLVGVYRGKPERCAYPDLLMRIRLGPEMLTDFLELLLLAERARLYLSGAARGTSESMVKINRDIVAAFPVQVPSVEEQREIVDTIASANERRERDLATLEGLRTVKSALMSVLLTGEVRVKPDEEAA